MDGSGLGIVLANHNSGGTWKRGNRSLRLCVGLIEPPLINLAHFGVPGYLKVSPSMRSAPQRRKCLIDEGGKSLPEGLVAARQQSRREHVGTIRTMLAHVPAWAPFDKGYRYRRQFPRKRWPNPRSIRSPLFTFFFRRYAALFGAPAARREE